MAGDLYLVDSNILIRWVQPADPGFPVVEATIKQLERSRAVPCYTSQNLGEFWNVLTRPANRNGYGLSPEDANDRAREVEDGFRLLTDIPAVHQEWRKLLLDYRVSGIQVHDARLVAAMHVHGVKRILTFNKSDFLRFHDMQAFLPTDVLANS
ncbi:MAG TPA: type II toxin-antitoxin system VapC family toxin [Terracidiphilus sp.]